MKNKTILLTGGMGYIGSHTAIHLLQQNYQIIIIDNLVNSSIQVLDRVKKITNKPVFFYQGDIRDTAFLKKVFQENQIDSVIHFAGLKAVGESKKYPLEYYDVNVSGTLNLCQVMQEFGVFNLVFSSSATVYGESTSVPFSEDDTVQEPSNPYGKTKWMVEKILQDLQQTESQWSISILRYFNPIGAHPSGLIGEEPRGVPNNLLPYITQVASGQLAKLSIFGNDYPTPDGTAIRDYIHIEDLVSGHLKALEYSYSRGGYNIWNLGTGKGYSVLEVVKSFESENSIKIPYQFANRREGDVAMCYADPTKAKYELGWQATYSLSDMLKHAWNWQLKNPNGYR